MTLLTRQKEHVLDTIIKSSNLIRIGQYETFLKGYSSECYVFNTKNGRVCIRIYPKKYDFNQIKMEIHALNFAYKKGIAVPKLIPFLDGDYLYIGTDGFAILYYFLSGETISQKNITTEIAQKAGTLLLEFVKISNNYKSHHDPLIDFDYIKSIYKLKKEELIKFIPQEYINKIELYIFNNKVLNKFNHLTNGIVHGDFYYDNIVVDDKNKYHLIDFGDAYFGKPFMDIVVGAMEFSTLENQKIDIHCFESFLCQFKEYLLKENITSLFFYNVTVLACIKFLILNLHLNNENDYFLRFRNFISVSQRDNILLTVNKIIGAK